MTSRPLADWPPKDHIESCSLQVGLHKGLQPFFTEARSLPVQGAGALGHWLARVRELERRRPGHGPQGAPAILRAVCEALFQGRVLAAHYRRMGEDEAIRG